MALTFEKGESDRPKGHAILYFRSSGDTVLATYVLVLPIKMDVGKYLPPLLASQFGSMAGEILGEGMTAFAAPPAPEETPLGEVRRLADLRGDDLVYGGAISSSDVTSAMNATAEATQEYARAYQAYAGKLPEAAASLPGGEGEGGEDVQHVLFGLMTDRERLGEASKAVGQARFGVERGDQQLLADADTSLKALEAMLPDHYWIAKLRRAAANPTSAGARLAQLYVDRCYKLLDEDFAAVQLLEHAIHEAGG